MRSSIISKFQCGFALQTTANWSYGNARVILHMLGRGTIPISQGIFLSSGTALFKKILRVFNYLAMVLACYFRAQNFFICFLGKKLDTALMKFHGSSFGCEGEMDASVGGER